MPSTARASTLTARMRAVSGERRRRRRRSPRGRVVAGGANVGGSSADAPLGSAVVADAAAPGGASAVAVAVSDAIERLDLGELAVDDFELLAQALDVAVDGPVVDVDVLAIGGVHQ